MILDYKEMQDEIKILKDYFKDTSIVRYTANIDQNSVDQKIIVLEATFDAMHADSQFQYLNVTFDAVTYNIMDDEFFINNGYVRRNPLTLDDHKKYIAVYEKNVAVMVG
jgi:hypothetical protein